MAGKSGGSVSWGAFANTKVGEVERPKTVPEGHYIGVISGAGELREAGQKNNLVLEFPVKLNEPMEDVDSDAFAASSGFNEKGYKVAFWITPDALYRLTEFGKGLGASDELDVPALAEFIATSGAPIVFEGSHYEGKGGSVFLNLDNPIPLSVWNEQNA